MISKKNFSFILLVTIALSIGVGVLICQFFSSKAINITANQPKRPIEDIKKEAFNGSADAYRELRTIYWDYSQEDFLFWALYVGNKFHNKGAYADVYRILEQSYNGNSDTFSLKGMDTLTKKLVIQYLDLAAKSGDVEAENHLANLK